MSSSHKHKLVIETGEKLELRDYSRLINELGNLADFYDFHLDFLIAKNHEILGKIQSGELDLTLDLSIRELVNRRNDCLYCVPLTLQKICAERIVFGGAERVLEPLNSAIGKCISNCSKGNYDFIETIRDRAEVADNFVASLEESFVTLNSQQKSCLFQSLEPTIRFLHSLAISSKLIRSNIETE